jgi:hypothetical protein
MSSVRIFCMELSRKPSVLYHASLERIAGSRRAFRDRDYALAIYLAGLGVECILQAISIRSGSTPDARHDLAAWLAKCPKALRDSIKGSAIVDWNRVAAVWDNGVRYLSRDGLLGYLRDKGRSMGIAGGPESVLRVNATRLINSAAAIHKRGIAQWVSSTGS